MNPDFYPQRGAVIEVSRENRQRERYVADLIIYTLVEGDTKRPPVDLTVISFAFVDFGC